MGGFGPVLGVAPGEPQARAKAMINAPSKRELVHGTRVAPFEGRLIWSESMADGKKDAHRAGGAAQRPNPTDTSKAQPGHAKEIGTGSEPTRGIPPGEHDHEHQSNYGGGGPNGGVGGGGTTGE